MIKHAEDPRLIGGEINYAPLTSQYEMGVDAVGDKLQQVESVKWPLAAFVLELTAAFGVGQGGKIRLVHPPTLSLLPETRANLHKNGRIIDQLHLTLFE